MTKTFTYVTNEKCLILVTRAVDNKIWNIGKIFSVNPSKNSARKGNDKKKKTRKAIAMLLGVRCKRKKKSVTTITFACWTYNLHKALLILSVFWFTSLAWFEKFIWKSKTWVTNAPVKEYIFEIFEIQNTSQQILILWKTHNNSFYAVCCESLESMSLILTLLEHELFQQVLREIFSRFQERLFLSLRLLLNCDWI